MQSDSAFLLWQVHQIDSEDDEKLIGVYQTKQDAEAVISRLRSQPGVRDFTKGCEIAEYMIYEDHWTESFVAR